MGPDEKVGVAPEVDRPTGEQNSFLEQLLRPQSFHRMMFAGGGTLVVGFVGWLWSIGMFDNPKTMATLLGGATLFVLAVGIALVRSSRYQQAGTGLTFWLPWRLAICTK